MVKIFPTDLVKEIDQYTIDNEPIGSVELVERAATMFTFEFTRQYPRNKRIVIFAGRGNNGADALAIARLLREDSYRVETWLFNLSGVLSVECEINRERLKEMKTGSFTEVIEEFEPPVLTDQDIVIDGLFRSGLNRALDGGFAALVDYINQSDAEVVSIDIPSGLFGEDNQQNNPEAIVKATQTFTFGFPKLAFFLAENAPFVGKWKTIDIGLHPVVIDRLDTPYVYLTEEDVADIIEPREKFAHKGTFGHSLLVAGSKGKIGAALLAARACLRSGAGLLTVHLPQRGESALQSAFPEAMISLDENCDRISVVPELAVYDAIGVGPGIGQHRETGEAVERLIKSTHKAMVIDADALNILSSNQTLYDHIPSYSILTPHPKEFDRLAGQSNSAYERIQKARAFAVERKVIIVLKGAYSAICTPSGRVLFNSTGNPGMATAGSGDVLTGILLGLLSQGYNPEVAAVLGVYLHGLAGDLAVVALSEESLIAGDIVDYLGKAFKMVK